MNRAAVVALALAVLVGSVPAAATLSGAQATPEERPAPGAAFAGVVDVQQAEIDSEVAGRSLDRRFAAAASNGSKARIVAEQQDRLTERLDELEAEKARLERAYENGSIGQPQYRAQLAGLAAQIRAVERRANQTASVAASLPDPALRDHGANVSRVRSIAQQASRTGGGAVAEAARAIAGEGVGNGLGPPNASQRGPSAGAGPPADAGPPDGDDPGNGTGPPDDVGPTDENGTEDGGAAVFGNETGDGPPDVGNATDDEDVDNSTIPDEGADGEPGDDGLPNGSDVNGTAPGVGTDVPGPVDDGSTDESDSDDGDDEEDGLLGDGTETPTPEP